MHCCVVVAGVPCCFLAAFIFIVLLLLSLSLSIFLLALIPFSYV